VSRKKFEVRGSRFNVQRFLLDCFKYLIKPFSRLAILIHWADNLSKSSGTIYPISKAVYNKLLTSDTEPLAIVRN